MESESQTQPQFQVSHSLGNLSQGKRRLTATELRQIQKMKRESCLETDPYLNQRITLTDFSLPSMEDHFPEENNTSSNRELLKTGPSHLFQTPFPSLDNMEYREVHATSSNSNSMLNFFSNLVDEFPNKKTAVSKAKKEENGKDTYKWSPNDFSVKTSVTFFSTKSFEDVFDTTAQFLHGPFHRENQHFGNNSTHEDSLPAQYKFTRQPPSTAGGDPEFLNALRSVYTLYKKDGAKKFYLLMRGVTCLFVHKKDKASGEKKGREDKAFSSMVVVACERKNFQQILTKNEIDFECFNTKKGSEEIEMIEKIPILESQTAFTKSFDFVDNVDIYLITKKQVQVFFNTVINELDMESQLEIISEYPFANSRIFYPKIVYNGPIRLNEIKDIETQEHQLEENQEQQTLKKYKIFTEERSLKVLYKLQIEGCILPITLKTVIEVIEKRQPILKTMANAHFITEKFNENLFDEQL